MSPQHAGMCAAAGMSRADVHKRLCELAVRRQGDIRNGGNWRPERARAMGADPDDDPRGDRATDGRTLVQPPTEEKNECEEERIERQIVRFS